MKQIIITLLASAIFASCTRYYCYPKKRDYANSTLTEKKRTQFGIKHTFVTDDNKTFTRYLNESLNVGECYLIDTTLK